MTRAVSYPRARARNAAIWWRGHSIDLPPASWVAALAVWAGQGCVVL